jgi:hypothetical protein
VLPPGTSPACVSFIHAALDPDPAKRPSAAQLLRHPWLAASAAAACSPPCGEPAWQGLLTRQQRADAASWQQASYRPCGYQLLARQPPHCEPAGKPQRSARAPPQATSMPPGEVAHHIPPPPPPAAAKVAMAGGVDLAPSWRRAAFDSAGSVSEPSEAHCSPSPPPVDACDFAADGVAAVAAAPAAPPAASRESAEERVQAAAPPSRQARPPLFQALLSSLLCAHQIKVSC